MIEQMLKLTQMMTMTAAVTTTIAPAQGSTPAGSEAFAEALRIGGIAIVAIFVVMGLLGVMIALMGRLFPADEEA